MSEKSTLKFKSEMEAHKRLVALESKKSEFEDELEDAKKNLAAALAQNQPTDEIEKQISQLKTLLGGLDGAREMVRREQNRLRKSEKIAAAESLSADMMESFKRTILPRLEEALKHRFDQIQAQRLEILKTGSAVADDPQMSQIPAAGLSEIVRGIEKMITDMGRPPRNRQVPENLNGERDPRDPPQAVPGAAARTEHVQGKVPDRFYR